MESVQRGFRRRREQSHEGLTSSVTKSTLVSSECCHASNESGNRAEGATVGAEVEAVAGDGRLMMLMVLGVAGLGAGDAAEVEALADAMG